MLVMTKIKLKFTARESNGDRLVWVSQGNNNIETAPEWIKHTKMFGATNGNQLTVLTQDVSIAVSKPKKKAKEDDESSV